MLALPYILAAFALNSFYVHKYVAEDMGKTAKEIETLATTLVSKHYAENEKVTYQAGVFQSKGVTEPAYRTITVPERIQEISRSLIINYYEEDCCEHIPLDKGTSTLAAIIAVIIGVVAGVFCPRTIFLLALAPGVFALFIIGL